MLKLYNKFDPIGRCLSHWRNREVKREVIGNLLDIACGDNRLVRSYRGSGKGIDIQAFQNVDLVVNDFSKIPFPDQSFDTVTIVASLNYFPNATNVLTEIRRILADPCRLIITMPNSSLIKYWLKIRDPKAHRLFMPQSEIVKVIVNSGFKILDSKRFMLGFNRLYVCTKS